MKRYALVAAAALLMLTGCAQAQPPVSEKVQDYYDRMQTPTATAQRKVVTVAFLGDSYSAGVGADPGAGYADILSRSMYWTPVMFAQGGTGYNNPGTTAQKGAPFPDRVNDVIASHPDIVIIQGGINDDSRSRVETAANDVFKRLHAGLPAAKIVAVGPVVAPKVAAERVIPVRDAIASAAASDAVTFIDPIAENWLPDGNQFISDGVHPAPAGHVQIAQRIKDDLAKAGVTPNEP